MGSGHDKPSAMKEHDGKICKNDWCLALWEYFQYKESIGVFQWELTGKKVSVVNKANSSKVMWNAKTQTYMMQNL